MQAYRPQAGVGLLIIRAGKVLLGQRKGAHGAGEFASTGGHLEPLETFKDAALRELREEAGDKLKVGNLSFLCVTNLTQYAPKHYVDVGMLAEWKAGEPEVKEQDKIVSWDWYDMENLPTPLFGVIPNYIEAYTTGKTYFDS